ncbi:hypothetical protein [Sporomusa termitida]|uniref:hypothetical protein n=1 Tax=Sporomusa termitida TaxID=2377 RepID=UPI0011853440|nr:hypothetical protein [Sporomusa termitida]
MTKQEQINQLTQKLLDCGYHAEQIKHIVREALEDDTGDAQEDVIIAVLETYLSFGIKCKRQGPRE